MEINPTQSRVNYILTVWFEKLGKNWDMEGVIIKTGVVVFIRKLILKQI